MLRLGGDRALIFSVGGISALVMVAVGVISVVARVLCLNLGYCLGVRDDGGEDDDRLKLV